MAQMLGEATTTGVHQPGDDGNVRKLESREGDAPSGIEGADVLGKDENGTQEIGKFGAGEDTTETDATANIVALKVEAEGSTSSSPTNKADVPHSEGTNYLTAVSERTSQPDPKEDTPPKSHGDESKSEPDSKLPSLLLRIGPAVVETEPTNTSSPSTILPILPNPSLPPRPRVDTWIAADVRPPRTYTDSYIAPRSPSPKRYEGHGSSSMRSRRDRSPMRTRRDEDRKRDIVRSAWVDDSVRRVPRSPREEDHFPAKRRRTEGDWYRDGREDARRESHDRPRDIRGRQEHESRLDHDSRTDRKDSRHHHRRGDSAERKPHIDARAASEERRDRRRSDHRDDRRSGARAHENGDARQSAHERETRDSAGDRDRRDARSDRSRKDGEDYADSRNSRSFGERAVRPREDLQPRSRENGTSSDRLRHLDEALPRTRAEQQDHRGDRYSGTDARHQETNARSTNERQNSPRKEHEGGKAVSSTMPRTGVTTNGIGHPSVTGKPRDVDSRTASRASGVDAAPENASNTRALSNQQQPQATSATWHQRPVPPSLTFNRNAIHKPFARSATSGSNSEPLTARRGFEIPPASASPVTAQTFNNVPRDTLNAPLQDKDYIISQYPELKNLIKPVWIENPKAPVANFLTGGKGGANGLGPRGPAYRIATGRLGGRPMTRAKLPIVGHPSIVGIGDDPTRIQAEKLACLSALFQLVQAGLMKAEEQPAAEAPEAPESPEADDADTEEVTQLSTGETITLRDARAFMDYYCKRFGFGQPEISYETVAMRAGPSKWEAIMEVGGKKIGLGAGTTKKMATRVCYLDVTSYLEKCDQALWREYLAHTTAQA